MSRESDTESDTDAPVKGKRAPVYHVFEQKQLVDAVDVGVDGRAKIGSYLQAWVKIATDVHAPNDRAAILSVIGTAEDQMPGFDAERRCGTFWAPLAVEFEPRTRTRTVTERWL